MLQLSSKLRMGWGGQLQLKNSFVGVWILSGTTSQSSRIKNQLKKLLNKILNNDS